MISNFNFNDFLFCHVKNKKGSNLPGQKKSAPPEVTSFVNLKKQYDYFLNSPHFEDSEFYSHEI